LLEILLNKSHSTFGENMAKIELNFRVLNSLCKLVFVDDFLR